MQAGIIAVYAIAIVLALFGRRWPAVLTFFAALAVSAYWLNHHITDPLAIAL
jgi:membrane protein implicated in regulation of membrane protease activity